MSKTADVLVPQEREVAIQGRHYVVRKLTLAQVLRLAHFANGLQSTIKDELRKIEDTYGMIELIEKMAGHELAQILEILLGVRGPEHRDAFIAANLEELTDFAVAFCEINDLAKLASNFRKIAAHTKDLLPKSGTPSPRSSGR